MNYLEYLLHLLSRKSVQIVVIIVCTLLSYSSIIQNEFAWDDRDTVVQWQAKEEWSSVPNFLRGENPPGHQGNYRPLRNILYILDGKLFGLNPVGYHVQSLLIQISASLLIYLITRRMISHPYLPFFTGLLFGLHPIHVEAVTWITSSMDMIGVVFLLFALYLYIRSVQTRTIHWPQYALAVVFSGLAFFTNEVTLTLPGLILLVDLYFLRKDEAFSWKCVRIVPFGLLDLGYLLTRYFVAHVGARANFTYQDPLIHFFVMLKAFLRYIQILMYPVGLSIDHSLGNGITSWAVELERASIQTKQFIHSLSWLHPEITTAILFILLSLWIAWKLRLNRPIASFAIVWFYMSFITTLNIVPTEAIMVERFAYLPSYGFLLLGTYLLCEIFPFDRKRLRSQFARSGWILMIMIVCLYGGITYFRNMDWKNDETLWSSTLKVTPTAILPRIYLANIYLSKGKIEDGMRQYEIAYQVNPEYPDVRTTLGLIYESTGKHQRALELLSQAKSHTLSEADRLLLIANAYWKIGKYDLSIETYKQLLELVPQDASIYNNIGAVYAMAGKYTQASEAFRTALKLNPALESAKINLQKLQLR